MRYFAFLHRSRKICPSLNIPEKLHWQDLFENLEKTHNLQKDLQFKQTGTTTIFSFGYQSCTLPRPGPFCWQNSCSGCNSGINLVVVLECTFFQLCSNTEQISWVDKIQKKLCKPPCCRSNQPLSKLHRLFAWCALFKVATFLFYSCLPPIT